MDWALALRRAVATSGVSLSREAIIDRACLLRWASAVAPDRLARAALCRSLPSSSRASLCFCVSLSRSRRLRSRIDRAFASLRAFLCSSVCPARRSRARCAAFSFLCSSLDDPWSEAAEAERVDASCCLAAALPSARSFPPAFRGAVRLRLTPRASCEGVSAAWPVSPWSAARRVVVERCDGGTGGGRWVRHRERGARASLTWPFSSLSPGWRPRRRGAIALRAPFSPVGGPHALASR